MMENLEILDPMNILNTRSGLNDLIDNKLLENIVMREPSFRPQEMQNSASSNDMNINDLGINRQMIEQVMQQMGMGRPVQQQNTVPKRRVLPVKQPNVGVVNNEQPAVQPIAQPTAEPIVLQNNQPMQSSGDISIPTNKIAIYGYTIPTTTLYLIIILALIGMGIYMMSGEKKKKKKEDHDEILEKGK